MISTKTLTVLVTAAFVFAMVALSRRGQEPAIGASETSVKHYVTKSGTRFYVENGFVKLEPEPGYLVPNMVHFIFGLDPTFGHIGFGLVHYLAVLGAYMNIQPDLIVWTHKYVPKDNPWFECARPLMFLNEAKGIEMLHDPSHELKVQHQADMIRMNIMLKSGGIYLDSDVVPLRSHDDLRRYNFTMGREGDIGLCNAVLIGAPNTPFIQRWWAEYSYFNPIQWAYHSVILPRHIQKRHPMEALVLPEKSFFYPLWTQLRSMYEEDDGYDYADNYGVHLWTSAEEKYRDILNSLTIQDIFERDGNFFRIMRGMLARAVDGGYMEHCPAAAEEVQHYRQKQSIA